MKIADNNTIRNKGTGHLSLTPLLNLQNLWLCY
jgi:hypothetical protein